MTAPPTILLIEDHPVVRDGCRRLLADHATVIEAASGRQGLALTRLHHPNLVIVDISLPDIGGLSVIARLADERPRPRILVFSMHEDAAFAGRALAAGAAGYITKSEPPAGVIAAVNTVLAGGRYLGHDIAQDLALMSVEQRRDPLGVLSRRELEVLQLVGQGLSLGTIADRLNLSYKTIANTIAQMKTKLGLRKLPELMRIAVGQDRSPA